MSQEPAALASSPVIPFAVRVGRGMGVASNWIQLLRFSIVGASGYVVNLAVFALALHALALVHSVAATLAFLVAVTNNFFWNRVWTFAKGKHGVHGQAARFLTISVIGFATNLVLLETLIRVVGMSDLPAQAIALSLAMPANFLGNRLWTFRV